MAQPSRKIVLTTFGSLGDLHPFIAIGLELQRRGHRAVIATTGLYREKVEAEGLGFAAVRPDVSEIGHPDELMSKVLDVRRGPEFVIRELMMRHLRESYEDIRTAAQGAHLLTSHPLTFATQLVARKWQIPWIATVLSPLSFFSAYDPPVPPPLPGMARLRGLGPGFHRAFIGLVKRFTRSWTDPVRALRQELGLPGVQSDPMYEGQFSPALNLALFSTVLGKPQPDWPQNTVVTGFQLFDKQEPGQESPPEMRAFLDAGPPPIVFTLGSSAVMQPGSFYRESAEAAKRLGRRAILLVGSDLRNRPEAPLPDGIAAFSYAPYSELFPRSAAIVHSGGIGTTAQALRAGRPMVVVPFGFDQPDNAARVERLGVARIVVRGRYNAKAVVNALGEVLGNESYAQRAEAVGAHVRAEDGARTACDAIERVMGSQ